MGQSLALQKSLHDVLEEYQTKHEAIEASLKEFEKAGNKLKSSACIAGTYGGRSIDTGRVHRNDLQRSLLYSAWTHVYNGLKIDQIASAKDKKLFEQAMADPAPFTLDNIRETFGDYLLNPRQNILRGLAEVFCSLDQYYKSHERVKIGVKGLPKRVILSNVSGYGSWGRERLRDILNALAQYQGKPLVTHQELNDLLDDETALLDSRGVKLRCFQNGNGHLFFEKQELLDINRALSEYYGEVLPDAAEEVQKQQSTSVSKDLQYYPTPHKVIEKVLKDIYSLNGALVLEPSCGCGRIMDALRERGAVVHGIEYDQTRAQQCLARGHNVVVANFLETVPTPKYDYVVMNPPFYGKHYAKHVQHALGFLKDDGSLFAILPSTARYDHGLLDGRWYDLPLGSFSDSGTNVNTSVLVIRRER